MKQPLTNSELSVFSGQLAMILHSGISVLEGISIMRDDTPTGDGQQILSEAYETLELTGDLMESLKKTEVFPDYFLKMTEIGERSGTLEEVMDALSSYYDRQNALMRSIRDALVYPLVMLGMLTAVLVVLMSQVMPIFSQVFEQLGIEITGISGTIFHLSKFMQRLSAVLLVLVLVAAAAVFIMLRLNKGKEFFLKLTMILPIGQKTGELLDRSRFCDAFQLALHSGLDMEESFQMAFGFAAQDSFKERLKKAHELMEQGEDLSVSLKDSGIITGLNARMMTIGFHTGSYETVFKQIAVNSMEEADQKIQAAVGALEPTLTAVLSVLTGLILISVMLPLLGVMTNIG